MKTVTFIESAVIVYCLCLLGCSEPSTTPQSEPKWTNSPMSVTNSQWGEIKNVTGFDLNVRRYDRVGGAHFFITNDIIASEREAGIRFALNVTVIMTCGERVTLKPGVTIPTANVPCPCGATNHWLWEVSH